MDCHRVLRSCDFHHEIASSLNECAKNIKYSHPYPVDCASGTGSADRRQRRDDGCGTDLRMVGPASPRMPGRGRPCSARATLSRDRGGRAPATGVVPSHLAALARAARRAAEQGGPSVPALRVVERARVPGEPIFACRAVRDGSTRPVSPLHGDGDGIPKVSAAEMIPIDGPSSNQFFLRAKSCIAPSRASRRDGAAALPSPRPAGIAASIVIFRYSLSGVTEWRAFAPFLGVPAACRLASGPHGHA